MPSRKQRRYALRAKEIAYAAGCSLYRVHRAIRNRRIDPTDLRSCLRWVWAEVSAEASNNSLSSETNLMTDLPIAPDPTHHPLSPLVDGRHCCVDRRCGSDPR